MLHYIKLLKNILIKEKKKYIPSLNATFQTSRERDIEIIMKMMVETAMDFLLFQ